MAIPLRRFIVCDLCSFQPPPNLRCRAKKWFLLCCDDDALMRKSWSYTSAAYLLSCAPFRLFFCSCVPHVRDNGDIVPFSSSFSSSSSSSSSSSFAFVRLWLQLYSRGLIFLLPLLAPLRWFVLYFVLIHGAFASALTIPFTALSNFFFLLLEALAYSLCVLSPLFYCVHV